MDLARTLHCWMGRDGRSRTLWSKENWVCACWMNWCHLAWSCTCTSTRSCRSWTYRLRSCRDGHASTLSSGTCWVCLARALCYSSLWSCGSRSLSSRRHTMDYTWTLCNWESKLGVARSLPCKSCWVHPIKTSCSRACWVLPVASFSCWSWTDQLYCLGSTGYWKSWLHSY